MRKVLSIALTLVMILCASAMVQAQNRVLKGVVTASPDGEPMPGVTILDKTNQTGTTTNIDEHHFLGCELIFFRSILLKSL